MQVRKAVAGSVIGGSMVAMAVAGMGTASAEWGGQNGAPGGPSVSNITDSYNSTKTVTVTKTTTIDDHSINTALFSNNTTTIKLNVKVVALNGNKLANGNKLFSGNNTPVLNGLRVLNTHK